LFIEKLFFVYDNHCELQSGKVSIERCNSSEDKVQMKKVDSELQDLNFPPPSTKVAFNLFNETCLDLNLASHSLPSSNCYTIDKVKSALERVEKNPTKKRASPFNSSYFSSVSYSSSSSSLRDTQEEEHVQENLPMCNYVMPFPLKKKPKIDLNLSL